MYKRSNLNLNGRRPLQRKVYTMFDGDYTSGLVPDSLRLYWSGRGREQPVQREINKTGVHV